MVLPLMDLSHIATWEWSLTPLSSCLMSNQPQSSAKAVLLACKSVLILPCDPFSFRPVLCLSHSISVASSLCSYSFFINHPSHPFMMLLPEWFSKKKKKNYPFFTNVPPMASITYCINLVILSILYEVLYGLASPHPSGVLTATLPFTPGFTVQLSDPPVLKWLWFSKALCSSVPHCSSSGMVPLNILVPLLRILSIQMAPQPVKLQVLLQHSV